MLRTLTNEVRSCYEHAESCASSAGAAPNDGLRDDYRRLEGHWLTLARSYELSLRLNDFTDYQRQLREKQRLELQESNMHRAVEAKMSDVYITRELDKRTPGKVDTLKEKIALQELAAIMADNPEQVLPKFVSLAMEMTHGVSAGISLYEEHPPPGVFRWHHLQGTLARFAGATTPRNFSPCGIVLDLDAPVLTAYSERAYDWLAECNVSLPEVLLVPLHIGSKKPTGTLWIVSDEDGHFHREHARVATELASFVAIAVRMIRTEQRLQGALEQQRLLAGEMSHRIKNLFAMTDGLIRLSAKDATTKTDMSALLSGRLHALANAHSLVPSEFSEPETSGPTLDLKELIGKIVFPYETNENASRFSINGPPIRFDERETNGIALMFHELATNAAKYGSLRIDDGRVEINWHREDDGLIVSWTERGGPTIEGPPSEGGFGSQLMRRIADQFGAKLTYDWQPNGLVVTLTLPAKAIAEEPPPRTIGPL